MKVPTLELRLVGRTAFCGRCHDKVGPYDHLLDAHGRPFSGPPQLSLPHGDRMGWVEINVEREDGTGAVIRSEFAYRRRRHPNPLKGPPVTPKAAHPNRGDVVRCPNPRCEARQVYVPPYL